MIFAKSIFTALFLFIHIFNGYFFGVSNTADYVVSIPAEGNSWVMENLKATRKIVGKGGIKNWSQKDNTIRTYFKIEKAGNVHLGIRAKSKDFSEILVVLNGESKKISVSKSVFSDVKVGNFNLPEPGYYFVEMQGIKRSGDFFPEVEAVLLGGEVAQNKVWFTKNDFYWGRRGPSVHLNFQVPGNAGEVLYFYNEILVPDGNDVLGSYFMANGFGQGYFGIQVNSPHERRVLFSVWSPFKTDDPKSIPEDQKIKLLAKGQDVYAGEFGNEGSGGQSFLRFNWKTGVKYKFLLRGKPTGNNETDFTAWFFAPETGKWKLIAGFRRPKTHTYLTNLYSFLENFYTETGHLTRHGNFANQWIYNTNNEWIELNKIKFTADATARKESRMDYAGGVVGNNFFLKNCGFFSETTPIDTYFSRPPAGIKPKIDFKKLP